jgi:hypothetical protein
MALFVSSSGKAVKLIELELQGADKVSSISTTTDKCSSAEVRKLSGMPHGDDFVAEAALDVGRPTFGALRGVLTDKTPSHVGPWRVSS